MTAFFCPQEHAVIDRDRRAVERGGGYEDMSLAASQSPMNARAGEGDQARARACAAFKVSLAKLLRRIRHCSVDTVRLLLALAESSERKRRCATRLNGEEGDVEDKEPSEGSNDSGHGPKAALGHKRKRVADAAARKRRKRRARQRAMVPAVWVRGIEEEVCEDWLNSYWNQMVAVSK